MLVEGAVNDDRNDLVLVIGQYVRQLEMIARELNSPLITGKTP